jgi:hypothetical protein
MLMRSVHYLPRASEPRATINTALQGDIRIRRNNTLDEHTYLPSQGLRSTDTVVTPWNDT